MNLVDHFFRTAERQPDHPAIVSPRTDRTDRYRDLADEIDRTAEKLAASGVTPGQCVGLHVPSGRDYIVLTYALWRCGACVSPIAVELTKEEKLEICESISLHHVISPTKQLPLFESLRLGEPTALSDTVSVVEATPARSAPDGFDALNSAFLRFTSGTTGTSKGVALSHEAIDARIHAANEVLKIGPEDRVIWLLSMSYHFAVTIVSYLSFGATIVLCPNSLGKTMVETTRQHAGTLIYGAPTHFQWMARQGAPADVDSLRLAISTTTALAAHIADAFLARFDMPLNQAYGIIEIGLPCINDSGREKPGSVGRVLPAYEIDLAETALGEEHKAIRFRGRGFLDAYYEPWQTRQELTDEGWFATGDLGYLDEDGYLFITGRSKEVISVAGVKFFPREVERVLDTHPAIAESLVYPRPHDVLGEVPHARIVLSSVAAAEPEAAELKRFLGAHVAQFKIPRQYEVVPELPKTASGKLLRRA